MSFFLSEETPLHIETESWAQPAIHGGAFWQMNPHTRPARMGLVILAGSRVTLPHACVAPGESGLLVFGAALPIISSDGLDVVVRVAGAEVWRQTITKFDTAAPWSVAEINWKGLTGNVSVECTPGPQQDPAGDWLAVYELVSAPAAEIGLVRARAFRELREKNVTPAAPAPLVEEKKRGLFSLFQPRSRSLSPPGPHRYATDLLQKDLKRPIPDFAKRLQKRDVRMLSLCSGDGQKELRLLERVKRRGKISLTLVERAPALSSEVRERLTALCDVRVVDQDVNTLDLQGDRFDVILCTGGLSRIVELEHVAAEIAKSLSDDGEFWAIGQYIGRNGAMLWPDAYAIANPFFRRLAPRYRVNHSWPEKPVDADLPNSDCSIGTLNCIRTEDIERCLEKHLAPVEVTKQTCFLWRFFDATYRPNYDLERKEDRAVVARAARVDAEHQRHGGKPSSLDGVFRRR